MNIEEIKYDKLMEELQNLKEIDIDERFSNIETHLKHFVMISSEIERLFKKGVMVRVDEETFNVINPIKEIVKMFREEVRLLGDLRKEFQDESVFGTLKFMAKSIHEMKEEIHSIKEKGIKKSVHLALTMDGHELVKKKNTAEINESDEPIEKLLNTLSDREKRVLIHRFGLFGVKSMTLLKVGELFGVGPERIRTIQVKALRKCRHPSRRHLVEQITHLSLKNSILMN